MRAQIILVVAAIALMASVISCMGSGSSSSSMSSMGMTVNNSAAPMSKADAQVMIDAHSSSADSDLHNILGADLALGRIGSFVFPGFGVGLGFGFGFDQMMFAPIFSCITVSQVSNTAADMDTIYTFKCLDLTGTYEVKSTTSATAGSSFEIVDMLNFTNPFGYSSSANSTYMVSKSVAGVVTITKQYDDKTSLTLPVGVGTLSFSLGMGSTSPSVGMGSTSPTTYTLEQKGNSNYVFTPTSAANPAAGGAVQISGMFDVIKNGVDEGAVTVTSNNLQRAACGFDAGSISYKTPADVFVLTFTACGQASLTDNGTPVMLQEIHTLKW